MASNRRTNHAANQRLLRYHNYIGFADDTLLHGGLSGRDAIHHAAMNLCDNASEVEIFLDAGEDVNLRDVAGQTPLHKAAFYRNKNIVNVLLNCGADVNAADNKGNTPLSWALIPNNEMDNPYTPSNQMPVVKSLLGHGADVNTRNNRGLTPLMASSFSLDVIKVLLEAGADVSSKTGRNNTCLHYLLLHPGKMHIMKELVKAGASVFDRNDNSRDPIHCIVHSCSHSMKQKVEELKEVMKISTLVNNAEKLDFGIDGELRDRIGKFDDECYAEAQTMQSVILISIWTLRDFVLHGIGQDMPEIVDLAFEKLMEHNFSIYNDYIISHFNNDYLVSELLEVGIIVYSRTGLMDVKLRDHLIPDFCEFLSKNDIYHLLHVIFNS